MKRTTTAALVTAAVAGLSSPAHADVVIGPRVAYYFDNSNLRTSNEAGFDITARERDAEREAELNEALPLFAFFDSTEPSTGILADQIGFPMYGGTINFGDDRDRFTLTAMYGEGQGDLERSTTRQLRLAFGFQEVTDIESTNFSGESDVERIDIEATWQRRLNENFALTGGVRFEQLDVSETGTQFIQTTEQIDAVVAGSTFVIGLTPPERFDVASDFRIQTFTARFGATAFVPLSGSVNSFFSGMVQAGYSPETDIETVSEFTSSPFPLPEPLITRVTETQPSEISVGPDMAVGLQWIIADNLALDVRYRAVVFFPLTGEFEFSDAQVNHGVNLGVTLRL